ncbi:MAG: acetate--CoA ligase family protein [Proteobacteria bacterium]|nr:acetate--CoA ligase family protein [Pseudomonadota bacterium]
MEGLDFIFAPKSIALVGASSTKGKVGHDIFANVIFGGYQGTIYPVNPKAQAIMGVKCYPSLLSIPDPVDLAMVILPPKLALQAAHDCVKKGVKGMVIISAGFKEVGGEGLEIENQIKAVCKEAGIRIVGPNCLGVINPASDVSLNASFSSRMPNSGNISFISQSGALCTAVLDFAADRGFGFSKFISIGNKADVDELDLLKYYHADPKTHVIMIYMEELTRRGKEFIDVAKNITSGENPTPILVIKSGSSVAGAAAAASHTGSLAGSDAAYNAIFSEGGIIRCESVNQLFDFALAFSARKIPTGNRIAIITNAGGPGIIATDMTEHSGLKLAKFSEETVEELKRHLPPTANFHNPVDVIGDAARDRYENALATVISDSNVDGVLIILTPQSMTDAIGTAQAIVQIFKTTQKPIACAFMGVVDVSEGVKILNKNHVPVYDFPENAASALGALNTANRWLNRKRLPDYKTEFDVERARTMIQDFIDRDFLVLGEVEGAELLKCYGFKTLEMKIATSGEEAAGFAEAIGFPVVMKIVSPDILHKSDAKGVKVGIRDRKEAENAFAEIIDNAKAYKESAVIKGVLIQKMASPGDEVILGMNRDIMFGPMVMFGLGGIFVELFKDVIFRIAPFGRNVARRMIKSIKAYPLLTGFRGKPVADIEIIERNLVALSQMVDNHPEIKELDINPLLVHKKGEGATVADVIITLNKKKV